MRFTESHEWVRLENEYGIVGISKQAQEELGEIVHVEFPALGKHVKAGEEIVVLESTKAACDIYAPISGEIIAINTELKENPGKINTDPEAAGWLFKIKLINKKEWEALLTREQYLTLVAP